MRTTSHARSRPRRRSLRRTRPRAPLRWSTTSGVRQSGWRRSCCEPFEVREPDLDQRPDRLLEPGLLRNGQRLLVALPDLVGGNALFQPVVARQEQIVDLLSRGSLVDAKYLTSAWLRI